MSAESIDVGKDGILRHAFVTLRARDLAPAWATAARPYSDLQEECRSLMDDPAFAADLGAYLRSHTIVRRAITMFFTFLAMSASARWQDVPDSVRGVAARGWFLGRWLPTFLIVDGPIGRLMCSDASPFNPVFGTGRPILTAARDFLNDRLFRLLRNGVAHWGFDWEVVGNDSYVVAYDWERDLPTAKLHQAECDAFHILAFSLVELLHDVIIKPGGPEAGRLTTG